jgi:hypothetical protein
MTISMYAASVPVFQQMLGALSAVLTKAEAHATQKNIQPEALLQARLFPDMLNFTRQVQIAVDFAKGASAAVVEARELLRALLRSDPRHRVEIPSSL